MSIENLEIEHYRRYERRPLPTMRDLMALLFRQRRAMLIAFALVLMAVFISGIWMPKYEAHMKILVRRQRIDAMVTPQANAPMQVNDSVSEEDLNSEVELLNSEDLLRSVVLTTGLAPSSDPVRLARTVRELGENLTIEPLRRTNVISVRYKAHDPQLAQKVLNVVSTAYMAKHLEVHRPSGELKFFDQQTNEYREKLQQAQATLTAFTKRQGVVSADVEKNLALQRADDFEAAASNAHAGVAETQHRIESLRTQLNGLQPRLTTLVRTGENSQVMSQLKSTLLNLQLKRTELLTKFDPNYRPVTEVEKQIAETQSSIEAEQNRPLREETTDQNPTYMMVKSELAKAEAELNGLKARQNSSESIAAQYRQAARSLEESGVTQDELTRAAKTQEENYLLYVRKREEARISDALDQRGIINVAIAEQPITPAVPVRSPLMAGGLALLLGCCASIGTAFAVDFVDPSFRTPDEVVGYLDMPVLAALPKGKD